MSENNKDFVYGYSEKLKQKVAVSRKTGNCYCQDGAKYSAQEIKIIKDAGGEASIELNILKRVFGGTVIEVKEK